MDIFQLLAQQSAVFADAVVTNALLFWNTITHTLTLAGVIDILLVSALLWWLYRHLRKSDLIKVFPRLLFLLITILISHLLGFVALAYLAGGLFVLSILAIASLYAADIKKILEQALPAAHPVHRAEPHTLADTQTMVSVVSEALAVLMHSQKSALVVIKHDRSLSRLVANGTKMDTKAKANLIIDFFSSATTLSRGAVVIEGDRIVAAGSRLWRSHAKVLFHTNNPDIVKVAEDLGAVVVLYSKALSGIALMYRDQIYTGLNAPDLKRQLHNILLHSQTR